MRKDAPLAFRIPAELKKRLQEIANREARSISQICEMLLSLGVEDYETKALNTSSVCSLTRSEDPLNS